MTSTRFSHQPRREVRCQGQNPKYLKVKVQYTLIIHHPVKHLITLMKISLVGIITHLPLRMCHTSQTGLWILSVGATNFHLLNQHTLMIITHQTNTLNSYQDHQVSTHHKQTHPLLKNSTTIANSPTKDNTQVKVTTRTCLKGVEARLLLRPVCGTLHLKAQETSGPPNQTQYLNLLPIGQHRLSLAIHLTMVHRMFTLKVTLTKVTVMHKVKGHRITPLVTMLLHHMIAAQAMLTIGTLIHLETQEISTIESEQQWFRLNRDDPLSTHNDNFITKIVSL